MIFLFLGGSLLEGFYNPIQNIKELYNQKMLAPSC